MDPTATIVIVAIFAAMGFSYLVATRFNAELLDDILGGAEATDRGRVVEGWKSQGMPVPLQMVIAPLGVVMIGIVLLLYGRVAGRFYCGTAVLYSMERKGKLDAQTVERLLTRFHDATCDCKGRRHAVGLKRPMPPDLTSLTAANRAHGDPMSRHGMRYAYWLVNDARTESLRLAVFAHDPDCIVDHGFGKAIVLRAGADLAPWRAEGFEVLQHPRVHLFAWDATCAALKVPPDAIVMIHRDDDVDTAVAAYGRACDALDDQDDNPELCAITGPYFVATKAELDARAAEIDRTVAKVDAELDG